MWTIVTKLCCCCRFGCFLAGMALLLLLGLVHAGEQGSYLGCFDPSLMELSADNSNVCVWGGACWGFLQSA